MITGSDATSLLCNSLGSICVFPCSGEGKHNTTGACAMLHVINKIPHAKKLQIVWFKLMNPKCSG
jgi:hypothetical protein